MRRRPGLLVQVRHETHPGPDGLLGDRQHLHASAEPPGGAAGHGQPHGARRAGLRLEHGLPAGAERGVHGVAGE